MGFISQGLIGFSESTAPSRRIKAVQFGILEPKVVKELSVVHVVHPESYDENDQPVENGLADPKLGTIDQNFKCATCEEDSAGCQGHWGHIELARPVFHHGLPRHHQENP